MFSERLKRARELSGLGQEELADLLSISKGTVGNWETGTNAANAERLAELAVALNTTTDFLLGLSENPEADRGPSEFPRLVLHYRGGRRIIPLVDGVKEQGAQVMLAYAELARDAVNSAVVPRVPPVATNEIVEAISEQIQTPQPRPPAP